MSGKRYVIGIIAEDDSDVESANVLIRRITNKNLGIKKWVGQGCGKLKRKCFDWANDLKKRGCTRLIIIHDLDKNDLTILKDKIETSLNHCPIRIYLICIPVQELESWLLSDPMAIKESMKLKNNPNVKMPPETINSPKEYLGLLIRRASAGEKIYINTKHNPMISEFLSIDKALKRCPSFRPFYEFVKQYC